EPFDEPSGTDNNNYVDRLNRLCTSGRFSRPIGLPAEYRLDARDAWARIKALNKAQKSGTGVDPSANEIHERIREVVEDMRGYRNAAQEQLANRETPTEQ